LVVYNYPVPVPIVHEPVVAANTVSAIFVANISPAAMVIDVTAAAGNIHIHTVVHEPVTVSTAVAVVVAATNFNLSTVIATA
jgi:hypothetical protein